MHPLTLTLPTAAAGPLGAPSGESAAPAGAFAQLLALAHPEAQTEETASASDAATTPAIALGKRLKAAAAGRLAATPHSAAAQAAASTPGAATEPLTLQEPATAQHAELPPELPPEKPPQAEPSVQIAAAWTPPQPPRPTPEAALADTGPVDAQATAPAQTGEPKPAGAALVPAPTPAPVPEEEPPASALNTAPALPAGLPLTQAAAAVTPGLPAAAPRSGSEARPAEPAAARKSARAVRGDDAEPRAALAAPSTAAAPQAAAVHPQGRGAAAEARAPGRPIAPETAATPTPALTPVAMAAAQRWVHSVQSEPTAPLRPLEPGFAEALGQRLRWWAEGGVQQAELQLHPADLGPVQVWIGQLGAHTELRFMAEAAATREALQAALPQLQAQLSAAGLQLGSTEVHSGPRQSPTPQDHAGQGQGGRNPGGKMPGGEAEAGIGPMPSAPRSARGLLDLYA